MELGELDRVKVSLGSECSILAHWAVLYLRNNKPHSFEILKLMFSHFATITLKFDLLVKFNFGISLTMRS